MPSTDRNERHDPRTEVSDEALVVRYRRGDRTAFAELVSRHSGSIFTFAWYLTGDVQKSEAVVHAAYLEVVIRASEFRHETRFKSWVFDMALKAAREQGCIDPVRNSEPAPGKSARGLAHRALQQLPILQREVLLLAELGGLRLDEIAELLELDGRTLRTQLGYAIDFLRKAFSGVEEYARALR